MRRFKLLPNITRHNHVTIQRHPISSPVQYSPPPDTPRVSPAPSRVTGQARRPRASVWVISAPSGTGRPARTGPVFPGSADRSAVRCPLSPGHSRYRTPCCGVRSGQVRSGQVRSGQVRPGQQTGQQTGPLYGVHYHQATLIAVRHAAGSGQVRSGQQTGPLYGVHYHQATLVAVRHAAGSGQVRSGQVRSGQVRSRQVN